MYVMSFDDDDDSNVASTMNRCNLFVFFRFFYSSCRTCFNWCFFAFVLRVCFVVGFARNEVFL